MTLTSWTLIWVALPFISGFLIYLLPKIDRYLTIITLALTTIYPCWLLLTGANFTIPLKDNFGGIPLVVGFVAKVLTLKELTSWQFIVMNIAAVGTAIVFAKFIFLPHSLEEKPNQDQGFWLAIVFLLLGLFVSNLIYPSAYYNISNMTKSLVTIAIGWTIYLLVIKKTVVSLPHGLEKIDNLIGVMSLTLVGLFWLVMPSL